MEPKAAPMKLTDKYGLDRAYEAANNRSIIDNTGLHCRGEVRKSELLV